jgi:hypothetical protein
MLLAGLTAFVAATYALTPFIWDHPPVLGTITLVTSVIAGLFAVWGIIDSRYRAIVAVAGGVLGLANFAFIEAGTLTLALNASVGFLFFLAGVCPTVQRTLVGVQAETPIPVEPEHRHAA